MFWVVQVCGEYPTVELPRWAHPEPFQVEGGMMDQETTINALSTELTELEAEISRLRLTREKATYKLERAVRERDRVARHLASLAGEEGAV